MVLGRHIEGRAQLVGRQRLDGLQELLSLQPGSLAFVGAVHASGIQRHLLLVDKRIDVSLDIGDQLARVGPGFIDILERLLDGNNRHGEFYIISGNIE